MKKQRNSILFGSLYALVLCANLAAISIVLGKYLAINVDQYIRISFESLPVIAGGFFFGPVAGALIGTVADVVGCVMVGYTINPIITAGAAVSGTISGLIGFVIFKNQSTRAQRTAAAIISTVCAHIFGSMIIKSIGMAIYYDLGFGVLWVRIPLYVCIAAAEGALMTVLANSRIFIRERERLLNSNRRGKV